MTPMKRILTTTFAIGICLLSACTREYPEFVTELDEMLAQREIYNEAFQSKVGEMKISLERQTDPLQIYDLQSRLAKEYSVRNFDKSQSYLESNYEIARQLRNERLVREAEIAMAFNFSSAGYYQEAYTILQRLNPEELDKDQLEDYYFAQIMYSRRARNDAPNEESLKQNQLDLENWLNLVEPLVDSTSYRWNYIQWEKSRNRMDYISGLSLALKTLETATKGTSNYSEAGFYLALSHRDVGDEYNYVKWLCNSAMNDVRIGSRSDIALISLGRHYYKNEDLDKAYKYVVEYAFPDAIKLNSRYNLQLLSALVQKVSESNSRIIAESRRRLSLALIALAILSVGLIATFILVYRKNVALRSTHSRLKSSDNMKEKYITAFMMMLAENTMKRRNTDIHEAKMLRQGRTKELLDEIERRQEEEGENDFIKLFDTTFLDLYPDFVEKFNELLKPGEEIIPQEDKALTPELRIYALIKLGVTDLHEIAILLQYANSTIYNYRVKVLAKTLYSKKDFEDRVKKL